MFEGNHELINVEGLFEGEEHINANTKKGAGSEGA